MPGKKGWRAPLRDRLEAKIDRHDDGCWIWTAGGDSHGYGVVWLDGHSRGAHRVIYELLVEPIPDGMEIDHLCRVRECVNPEHMEIVTRRKNGLRGIGPAARNARKTVCKRGHPFEMRPGGGRICRICQREAIRAWAQQHRRKP